MKWFRSAERGARPIGCRARAPLSGCIQADDAALQKYGPAVKDGFVKVESGAWGGHERCIAEWIKLPRGEPARIETSGRTCRGTVEVAEAAYHSVEKGRTIPSADQAPEMEALRHAGSPGRELRRNRPKEISHRRMGSAKITMKVGVDTFTLRDLKLDPFQQLDYIQKLGLDGAQFGGVWGLSPGATGECPEAIRGGRKSSALYRSVGFGDAESLHHRETGG
jgi:hypothetical protein